MERRFRASADVDRLVASGDGNWKTRRFGSNQQITGQIDFAIDGQESKWGGLVIVDATFEDTVDLSRSTFAGPVSIQNSRFKRGLQLSGCVFEEELILDRVWIEGGTVVTNSEFRGDVQIRANFAGNAAFGSSTFRSALRVIGWRNITLTLGGGAFTTAFGIPALIDPKQPRLRLVVTLLSVRIARLKNRLTQFAQSSLETMRRNLQQLRRRFIREDANVTWYPVFQGGGDFTNVMLLKPDQVVFSDVDLSGVYLQGTNLRGARFLGVRFWQPKLNRNGLCDEVFIAKNPDRAFRERQLPFLEDACRSVRAGLEDSRSYSKAMDFYTAEMEAHRNQLPFLRRHLFSIAAIYRASSRYGASVSVALWGVLLLLSLHWALSMLMQAIDPTDLDAWNREAIRTARVLFYQNTSALPDVRRHDYIQAWVDIVARLLVPGQIAMLVLAFRGKVKRS